MATITINLADLHPGSLPLPLQGLISQDVWAQICHSVNTASSQAHCYSCAGEVFVCLCCVFPFIFLCHPCFYMAWNQSLTTGEVNRLNQAFFGGARVLGAINGALTVNTALLQGGGGFRAVPVLTQPLPASVYVSQPQPMPYSTPTPVASPQISSNKNTGAPSVRELNYSAIPSAEPVTVAAVPFQPQQPRMLYVTVPPNATTGQILTVSAPTGQLVQVTLPPGATPGQNLMVYY